MGICHRATPMVCPSSWLVRRKGTSGQVSRRCSPANASMWPSVPGLCGIGDVPHPFTPTNSSQGGGGDGNVGHSFTQEHREYAKNNPLKITFRYPLTPRTTLTWDTTLSKGNLYIEVPNGCLPDASREAFVTLLEYAEEVLKCKHAIVCFRKERHDRALLVRTFMFLGFYLVPPGSELAVTPHNKETEYVFLMYKID